MLEEPGGNKALVFDQGNRISNYISCADVAAVCVKGSFFLFLGNYNGN